jgi:transglutaminase-like putative cysteine protease
VYRIRIGCHLSYLTPAATPAVFVVQPAPRPGPTLERERLHLSGAVATGEYVDGFGNRCQRLMLAPGESQLRFDAVAAVPATADAVNPEARHVYPERLPASLLRFTLPSRYAETDKLLSFAWNQFAQVPAGWQRARAICEWVHRNIAYKRGCSLPHWSAADAIARREGVCRDRAHVVVALCRAFNMPARYAVAYLPDIDVPDDGIAMDFHAYAEVWLEGGWQVFDPHDLAPRKGRVFIASGLDAADAAFATLYGGARLTRFEVWADQLGDATRPSDALRIPSAMLPEVAPPPPAVGATMSASLSSPGSTLTMSATMAP